MRIMEFPQFSAFLITFRESLEALLIVGIICTYLTRIKAQKYIKWVWLGVILALLCSLVVAFVFQVVLTGFGGLLSQTYMRFVVMILSAALLTHMVVWVVKQSRDVSSAIHAKIAQIVTTGSIVNMIAHSYLVVLREAVETVFFFAAISGGDIGSALTSWGAISGVLCAGAVAFVFFKGTKKIPLSVFFRITGFFIIFIAAGLVSNSVGMLQDMNKMGSLYTTQGGQIGEVYNLVTIMPEHPRDEEHLLRDYGIQPSVSGNVGIFFSAMFGYTHNPSVEQFIAYWLYYLITFFTMLWLSKQQGKPAKHPLSAQLNVKKPLAG
jgi:high-affinity iron transporter